MLAAQDGKCAVCGTGKPGDRSESWSIDHDHVTGAVRGLLCTSCNLGIGQLGDDPDRIRAALNYVERHRRQQLRGVS